MDLWNISFSYLFTNDKSKEELIREEYLRATAEGNLLLVESLLRSPWATKILIKTSHVGISASLKNTAVNGHHLIVRALLTCPELVEKHFDVYRIKEAICLAARDQLRVVQEILQQLTPSFIEEHHILGAALQEAVEYGTPAIARALLSHRNPQVSEDAIANALKFAHWNQDHAMIQEFLLQQLKELGREWPR